MRYAYIIASVLAGLCVYLGFGVAWWGISVMALLFLPAVWLDRPSRVAVGVYIPAVLLVQLFKLPGFEPFIWLAFGATWVYVAWVVARAGAMAPAFLYLMSAMCYPTGRIITNVEFSASNAGFPYLLAANIFAILALVVAGLRGAFITRNIGTYGGVGLGRYIGFSLRAIMRLMGFEVSKKTGGIQK